MPIERNGKHWCNPAAEKPNHRKQWECSCGKVWAYESNERLWTEVPAKKGGK
jgi:hypothetical protein